MNEKGILGAQITLLGFGVGHDKIVDTDVIAFFAGQPQPIGFGFQEVDVMTDPILLGIIEHNPELIADDIQRDLTTADGALHEARNEVIGIIQHESVTRLWRQGLEHPERIGRQTGLIARPGFDLVVGQDKHFTQPLNACVTNLVNVVILVDDGFLV